MKLNDSIPDRVNKAEDQHKMYTSLTKNSIQEITLTRCVPFKLFTDCCTIKTVSNDLLLSEQLSYHVSVGTCPAGKVT